jgi:hypothetical protein
MVRLIKEFILCINWGTPEMKTVKFIFIQLLECGSGRI